jgi:hypothetical protein
VVLLLLLLVLILFALGFVLKVLFIAAAILFLIWIIGWLLHPSERRWYYW